MGMSRRKLFGFLAAAPVVAPVLVTQALKADETASLCAEWGKEFERSCALIGEKIVDPPFIAVGDASLYGETNLYAGSIVWTDPDYDERTGEVLRPIRMPWPSRMT